MSPAAYEPANVVPDLKELRGLTGGPEEVARLAPVVGPGGTPGAIRAAGQLAQLLQIADNVGGLIGGCAHARENTASSSGFPASVAMLRSN